MKKLIFAALIIVIVFSWLWLSVGPFWAVLGLVLLFVSLASFFLPTRYSIDAEGIRIKRFVITQYRPLTEFKRVYILENGILFSPFRKKTFLNNFRGLFLLLPKDKDNIIMYIKSQFGSLIYEQVKNGKP